MKSIPTQLPIFIQVAESGSFAQAARDLGISPPAVSKAIGRLESEWKVKLFYRTSHSLSLTGAGRQLYEKLAPAVDTISRAIEQISDLTQTVAGTIKVTLPASPFGQDIVLPVLLRFMERHPDVVCDLHFDDRTVDLIKHGFDVGIGTYVNEDSRLVARPLTSARFGLFASSGYVAEHGQPASIEDLNNHRCIVVRSQTSGRLRSWELNTDDESKVHLPKESLIVNNYSTAKVATVMGSGISYMGSWVFEKEIERGEVVPVLTAYYGANTPVWLYYASRHYIPERVRLLIRYLIENLSSERIATG